jgi:hypothetical protein
MTLQNILGNLALDETVEEVRVLVDSLNTLLSTLNSKVNLNDESRIKVASQPSLYDLVTGNITASGGTVTMDVTNMSNVVLHCKPSGSVAGHNCTFEGSLDSTTGADGTWFTIQAVRTNANTVETTTGALAAAPVYGWELSVNATRWIRIRATAHTSGTMTWMLQAGSYATEPIPAVQAHAVTLTSTTANIGTVAPTAYADTTTVLAASATYTGTSRDAGSTIGYETFVARAYSDQAGTLYIDDSTDNSTWRQVASVAVTAGECKTLEARITARYNRVRYVNGATIQTVFRVTSALHRI